MIDDAVEAAKKNGYVAEGDIVVITGGDAGSGAGTTNLMKVHLIERVLVARPGPERAARDGAHPPPRTAAGARRAR